MASLPFIRGAETSTDKLGKRWAWIRYPCGADGSLDPVTTTSSMVKVAYLSARGISLALGRRLESEKFLTVELVFASNSYSLPILARIVKVRKVFPSGWIASCEFVTEPSEETLHAFFQDTQT